MSTTFSLGSMLGPHERVQPFSFEFLSAESALLPCAYVERLERSVLSKFGATSAVFCQPLCLAQCITCWASYMPESDFDSLACAFEMYNEALSGLCLGAKRLVCWH